MNPRSEPLATRVRATLRAKADQVTVRPRPFDVDRPVTLAEAVPPSPTLRSRGRLAVAVAAVAVVAVLGTAAVVVRQSDGDGGATFHRGLDHDRAAEPAAAAGRRARTVVGAL